MARKSILELQEAFEGLKFIYSPLIGLSTKMQNKTNNTFLAFLRLFFVLEWTKKWFKASFETYIQGGGGEFVKNKSHKSMKTLKNAQK